VTTILLIRHALTTVPEEEQTPDSILSEEGILQAEHLAQRLSQKGPFHIVYTSFYKRARETSQIIAKFQQAEIREVEVLNEIGVWTSPTQLHAPSKEPEKYQEELRIIKEAQVKALDFLEKIAKRHKNETIAVVAHGNMIRGIIAQALNAGVETVVRLRVSNSSISVLEYDDDGDYFRLILFNDTSHL